MDVLTECRFLLNLVELAKTLVTGYLTSGLPANTVLVRGAIEIRSDYTVTDEAFLKVLFRKIYNEPYTNLNDDRVKALSVALAGVPRG